MVKRAPRHWRDIGVALCAAGLFSVVSAICGWWATGAQFSARSLQMSDSQAGATAIYRLSFDGQSGSAVGSLRLQLCGNSSLFEVPCVAPNGLDASHVNIVSQTGMGGFSVDQADTTSNTIVLTRVPGVPPPGPTTLELGGITNPAAEGTFFGRLETFASPDASGSHIDYGGLALSINSLVNVKSYVPPYLLFCVGVTIQPYDCSTAAGDFIDFGDLSATATATGHTQLLATTNAAYGYTLSVQGGTLTSGNNVIPNLATSDVSRQGVSQFGLNLRRNTTPLTGQDVQGPGQAAVTSGYAQPNFYRFQDGDVIAQANTSDDYRLYTASYIINIARSQPPGVYVTYLTYVALASF